MSCSFGEIRIGLVVGAVVVSSNIRCCAYTYLKLLISLIRYFFVKVCDIFKKCMYKY